MPTKNQGISEKTTNVNLKSPKEKSSFFRKNQFWKRTLENNDFLALYKRGGLAFKAINKISDDIFDSAFTTKNSIFKKLIKEYKLHYINRYAYRQAKISGYSLIFVGYADGGNFEEPANPNAKIDYFYVVPKAWVAEDKFFNDEVRDYYEIYEVSGQSFKVHESRIIRFQIYENGMSSLEPAYNALFTCDNMLWCVGQTLWRVGQGFPHISIDDPQMIEDGGELISEVEFLRRQAVLRDITSETGYLSDGRYTLKFVGAEGVALKPKEYYDIAFTEACIALGMPTQLMEGTAAGAVTGSETNLMDYYSDISSKQKREVQPLYAQQAELLGLKITDEDFDWLPLFEMDQKEISEMMFKDSESFEKLIVNGVLSEEQVFNLLKEKYPVLKLDKFSSEAKKKNSSPLKKIDGFVDAQPLLTLAPSKKPLKKATFKQKGLPLAEQDPGIARIEKAFNKRLKQQFKRTQETVLSIIQGFNTDATDAINTNTYSSIKTKIGKVFVNEKQGYKEIVTRFIDDAFDEGMKKAQRQLKFPNSLVDFNKANKAKKLLRSNMQEIQISLLEDMNKQVGILLSDVALNEIPLSNAQFKQEIQNIFQNKFGRLENGVVSETNNAFNQALEFGYEQSGLVTHKQWIALLDEVTCPVCFHLHGEIQELGKPFSTGDYGPIAHSRCRCELAPLTLTPVQLKKYKQ